MPDQPRISSTKDLLKDGLDAEVTLIDVMGDDQSIIDMARVCVAGLRPISSNKSLIRYLLRHYHTTPFEGVVTKWRVKCPVFVARQWFRHRTWSYNEVSQRYAVTLEEMHVPDAYRKQDPTNKQGSTEADIFTSAEQCFMHARGDLAGTNSYQAYDEFIKSGVSREQARHVLPMGVYTEFIGVVNLWNLMKFLHLRTDSHAQLEIRVFADEMLTQISPVCPLAMQAFIDYIKEAESFSANELRALKYIFIHGHYNRTYIMAEREAWNLSEREVNEFNDKIQKHLL